MLLLSRIDDSCRLLIGFDVHSPQNLSDRIDRRDLGPVFRNRLSELVSRSGLSKSAFAERIGVDRTALSQLLSDRDSRLPRAETLAAIARAEEVSLDWLLGLISEDTMATEVAAEVALEEGSGSAGESRLLEWRREAQGAKIRYVPSFLPDMLRLPALTAHEHGTLPGAEQPSDNNRIGIEQRVETDKKTLELSKTPEADFEICAPRQLMDSLAAGAGMYAKLPRAIRQAQLDHMSELLSELYPAVRLFIYDQRRIFTAPFTVFGAKRAAIYVGDMYLVMNARAHVQALTRRFDSVVRASEISDREAPAFLKDMRARD